MQNQLHHKFPEKNLQFFVGVAEGLIVVIQYWFGFALESGDSSYERGSFIVFYSCEILLSFHTTQATKFFKSNRVKFENPFFQTFFIP